MKFSFYSVIILLCLFVFFYYCFRGKDRQGELAANAANTGISDSLGRIVNPAKPVEKIIALGNYRLEAIKVLGAGDNVEGIDANSKENSFYYFPRLTGKPVAGTWKEPNYEIIASLHPDLVITSANPERVISLEEKLKPFGISLAAFDFFRIDRIKEEITKLGNIINRSYEADQYTDWMETYEKILYKHVREIDENKKPSVYMEWGKEEGKTWGRDSSGQAMCVLAGGRNIASEVSVPSMVSMEWVAEQNPDIIIKCINLKNNQWGWSGTREPERLVKEIKQRPGLGLTNAVKNNRVYVICSEIAWGPDSIVAAAYWAKWIHPGLEIAPDEIYREYVEGFMKIEYPEGLIFAYPLTR
ncbi:MAG: ABC transporter substrate-binding protein [Desulfobacteraceae bacterium]|jgi:iron complex transport system substrate-binding protein